MLKITFLLLASVMMLGCQTSQVKRIDFKGYLEKPITVFQININPTNKFKYKTIENNQITYTEEKIKKIGNILIKSSKISSETETIDTTIKLLSNGLIQEIQLKNYTPRYYTSQDDIDSLKREALIELGSSGIIKAASRYPDYALGQDIYEGFTSRCYLYEEAIKSLMSNILLKNRNMPRSSVEAKSDSKCAFVGYSYVQNRKVAIFSENGKSNIKIKGTQKSVTISFSGWRAIDLDKGLVLENSYNIYTKNNLVPIANSKISLISIE